MLLKYILLLAVYVKCNSERVIVELADGGKSRPLVIKPLEHDHDYRNVEHTDIPLIPNADALSMDNPDYTEDGQDEPDKTDTLSRDKKDIEETHEGDEPVEEPSIKLDYEEASIIDEGDKLMEEPTINSDYEEASNTNEDEPVDIPIEENNTEEAPEPEPPTIQQTEAATPEAPLPSTMMLTTTTSTTQVVTTLPPETSPQQTTMAKLTTEPAQPTITHPTQTPRPTEPCHLKCLEALNATRLYTKQKLVLSQGSDLNLTCELPLDKSFFILEDLIWLYHPEDSPVHQCSLTTKEFLPSCQGFKTISDTEIRNDTFIRESITLINMLANYSGQYMCQVKLDCCHTSHEHSMIKEKTVNIKVKVWLADYTIDLAIAGSIAAALAIIVLGGSLCIVHKQKAQYTFITDDIQEIKPYTVMHIPLVEDQDNDSFDSNSDEE